MHTLRVIAGPASGQSFDVDRELVIGREGADVTIKDPNVSRRHTAVRPAEGGLEVRDLGSLNGTFVDGRKLEGPVTISQDATIKIGGSELAVEIESAEPAAEQPSGLERTFQPTVVHSADPSETRPADARYRPTSVRATPPASEQAEAPPAPPPPPVPPQQVTAPRARSPQAPQPAAPERAPTGPPPPPAAATAGPRPRTGLVVGGVLAALAIAAIVVFALAARGSSTSEHELRATLRTGLVSQHLNKVLFGGVWDGTLGAGSVVIDQVFGGPPAKILKQPTPVSAKLVVRFDDGSFTGTLRATATPQPDKSVRVVGRVQVTGGTGKLDGASGGGTFVGGRPEVEQPTATFHLVGKIRY